MPENSSRSLALGSGVIGAEIGNGILRNPGIVATNLGAAWLILVAWTLGGIISLIGANTYAELSTALPEDGGPYVFIRRAYGDFWGFAGGMCDFAQIRCVIPHFTMHVCPLAESEFVFFTRMPAAIYIFTRDRKGKIGQLLFVQDGRVTSTKRL